MVPPFYAVVSLSGPEFEQVVPHTIDPLGVISGRARWHGGPGHTCAITIRETHYAPLATHVVIPAGRPPLQLVAQ